MSSDAGLTLLREVERRPDLAGLLASCLDDPRDPSKILHSLEDIIRFRIMMIAARYEDGNDAANLRHDPSFKISLERNPETGAALYSQPTISRKENLPRLRNLVLMGRAMIRFDCQSFARVPGQIVLDSDDTFDTRPEARNRFTVARSPRPMVPPGSDPYTGGLGAPFR